MAFFHRSGKYSSLVQCAPFQNAPDVEDGFLVPMLKGSVGDIIRTRCASGLELTESSADFVWREENSFLMSGETVVIIQCFIDKVVGRKVKVRSFKLVLHGRGENFRFPFGIVEQDAVISFKGVRGW